ncbi:3-demethylubiquinone-9 3-O-methyltransferase, partial [Pelagibacterales bacterium SAG-MED45]|nr:3-demethylubiquinone-9 3-O-methyltransferase [Pelagibacterales bacterium SAG-MED45]
MSSVNKIEIEKFSNMADEWWDPYGKFKPLHKFNPIRIKYIKENIIKQFKIKNTNKPLSGINILDVGCGGGLLSEPMCRLGANVTGIDASIKNIKISKLHAKKDKLKINYICSSPEKLKISKKFDVILNMEIVEHVEDISFFLKSCSELLNKNGLDGLSAIRKIIKKSSELIK